MKSLVRLQASALKSLLGADIEVPRLLALQGPNGSGKTAILQAVRLGVLGYEPTVGKRLQDTRKLAGGSGEIEVSLAFDDRFALWRTFGESAVTDVAPPKGERTERAKQARIEQETGAFVPSFDLESFLALSAEKRRDMLFGLLPRDAAGLSEAVFREWLGHDAAEATVQRAIDRLWVQMADAPSPLEGLASAITFVRDRFNAAEADRLAQVKVVQDADRVAEAASRAVIRRAPAGGLGQLQEELGAVKVRLGELREQEAAAWRAVDQQEARARRIASLQAALEVDEKHVEQLRTAERPIVTPSEIATAEEAAARLEKQGRGQRDAWVYAGERKQQAAARLEEARARFAQLEHADACPVCGQTGADLAAARQAAHADVDRLTEELTTLEREYSDAYEQLQRFDAQADQARGRIRELRALQADAQASAETIRKREAEIQARRAAIVELQAEEPPKVDAPDPNEIAQLQERAAELTRGIAELQQAERDAGKAERDRERADEARGELQTRTARREGLRSVLTGLQKLRGHVIQALVGPVEKEANAILQRIDPAKTFRFVFEREGRDDFDFGFEEAGSFRSFDAASTGEDAFLAVVFVAALIAVVRPAWPVLIVDNVEQVDPERRRWLMLALAEIADAFGNVIIAGCCDFAEVDGWSVLDVAALGRPAVAA